MPRFGFVDLQPDLTNPWSKTVSGGAYRSARRVCGSLVSLLNNPQKCTLNETMAELMLKPAVAALAFLA